MLLLLKRDPRRWSQDEIVAALRGSSLVVIQSVAGLAEAALVDVDGEGRVAYAPSSPDTAALVEQAEQLYASMPDQVRRLIVAPAAGGLSAFADAFLIRRD